MSGTEKLVTLKRLAAMLDAYGAETDRWPEEERAAALALIDGSAEAQSLIEEARALDDLLDQVERPTVSPALARRVRTMKHPSAGRWIHTLVACVSRWLHPETRAAWRGAVAAAAVIGIATGIGLSQIRFDRPVQAPATPVAATATTDTTGTATSVVWYDDTTAAPAAGEGQNTSTSLGPDIAQISLTGEDGANSGSLVQSDDSELEVASIPLY